MQGLDIREGVEADVDALLEIEARAATLLLERGGHDLLAMHALTRQDLLRGIGLGMLWVAGSGERAVGFALCGEVDGHAHLMEIDVDPAYGRRGIGSALLESVCEVAARRGYDRITLVTLREVPWNAPFYARRGFAEFDAGACGAELAALIKLERIMGIPPRSRVLMQRPLSLSLREAEG